LIVGVRGILEAVGADWVHLRVGGVTLQVSVPAATIGELGLVGGEAHLFTHLNIRDDQAVLYGFTSLAALDLFLMLLGVSGVGPRRSLALLSSLGTPGLRNAIAAGDTAALGAAPGVGRRTAGRIVLELKGKVEVGDADAASAPAGDDTQVIAALLALGYSTSEARRAVDGLDKSPDLTLEERVRLALQRLGGGG
jgi:Holliday junction DNA helicase RuvA